MPSCNIISLQIVLGHMLPFDNPTTKSWRAPSWLSSICQIGSIDPPPKLKMCDFYGQDFWCQALEHVAQQEVQSAKQSPKLRESQTESVAWRHDELPGGYKTDSCWK